MSRSTISKQVIPAAFMLIALLAASAQAQTFGPAWESNVTLTQEDLDLIHQTVDNQVHGKPVGTTVAWSNPKTGNAGTIKLLKRSNRGSLRCEQIAYTLTTTKKAVEPEHYVFNSCLTAQGWKIARKSPPSWESSEVTAAALVAMPEG